MLWFFPQLSSPHRRHFGPSLSLSFLLSACLVSPLFPIDCGGFSPSCISYAPVIVVFRGRSFPFRCPRAWGSFCLCLIMFFAFIPRHCPLFRNHNGFCVDGARGRTLCLNVSNRFNLRRVFGCPLVSCANGTLYELEAFQLPFFLSVGTALQWSTVSSNIYFCTNMDTQARRST